MIYSHILTLSLTHCENEKLRGINRQEEVKSAKHTKIFIFNINRRLYD